MMSRKYLFHAIILTAAIQANNSAEAWAQDLNDPIPQKTDLSNPDLISRPPSDPYSLAYTPPRPAESLDIATKEQCLKAGGKWKTARAANPNDPALVAPKTAGCKIGDTNVGRWMLLTQDASDDNPADTDILGYSWLHNGQPHGWFVLFSPQTHIVIDLSLYDNGNRNGTAFEWDPNGALKSVATYKNNLLDGKFEQYTECLPLILGQYKDDQPVGIWKIYAEPGKISSIRDYSRPIPYKERPNGMPADVMAYHTEWFNGDGVRIAEGYEIPDNDDPSLIGTRVGTLQLYSTAGQKWMDIHYSAAGQIDDKKSFEICGPDPVSHSEIPGFLDYDHEALSMNCKNAQGNIYRLIEFYNNGNIRRKTPYAQDNTGNSFIQGTVYEYHPNGKELAVYKYKNNVPDGDIIYKKEDGSIMASSNVTNGTGTLKTFWANGSPESVKEYKNGIIVGIQKTFYDSGTPKEESQFNMHGERDGYVRNWFRSGILAFEANISTYGYDGPMINNYSDGRIAEKCQFKKGRQYGICYEYMHSGKVAYETDFSDRSNTYQKTFYNDGSKKSEGKIIYGFFGSSMRIDNWQFYLKNGSPWYSLDYEDGKPANPDAEACTQQYTGTYTVDEDNREVGCMVCAVNRQSPLKPLQIREDRWQWWNENGKLEKSGSIHLGHLDGEWNYYYPNGKLMLTGSFKIDRRIGTWTGYFENGNMKFTGGYTNGAENGLWKTFHETTGNITSEGNFKNGRRDGAWIYRYENGATSYSGAFENGKEIGTWTEFYPNGSKKGEGAFTAGKREGTWTWWRENGDVWRTAEYKEGREIQKK